MAFTDLTPWPLAWKNLGLNFLLYPEDAPAGMGIVAAPRQAAQARQPEKPPVFRREKPAMPPRPAPPAPRAKPQAESPTPRWRPGDPAQWPKIWRNHFNGAKKGLIAWTYQTLGDDLAAGKNKNTAPDAGRTARGNFFRKIFRDFGYSAGTHVFWPASLPGYAADVAETRNIYWSALYHLGCRGVVIMGSTAAKLLVDSKSLKPLTMIRQHNQFIWILWETNTLARSPELYQSALEFLRRSFRQFLHI